MCDQGLSEHCAGLVLLRIDVEDAHVTFKDGENFAHKGWEHREIEVFVIEGVL